MTERVYPSSKSTPTTTTTTKPPNTSTTRLPPPPSKTPLPTTTTRHPYRPNPTTTRRRTRRRSCFCLCYFWTTLIIILLLLITTIAGCIFYLLYHPKQPSFSITSLKLIHFNLTTTNDDMTRVTSKFNLTLSTKNPNKKITFSYDPFTIKCFLENTQLADGKFSTPFVSSPNNITIVKSTLTSNLLLLESETVNKIKADLKTKSGLKLKIVLDSDVRVKVESVKSKKVGIRVKCDGIHSLAPKGGKNATWVAANVSAAKCKIDLRVKIWKWTF
ncbi:NDR1/HIN1-like protein 6 [Tanacetum coccineum]